MNVTKNELKDRQLHIEDYLQKVSAEQRAYAEVSVSSRITENNIIVTDFQKENLLEWIGNPFLDKFIPNIKPHSRWQGCNLFL